MKVLGQHIYIYLLVFFIANIQLVGQSNQTIFEKNPNYVQQMGLYEVYKTKSAKIVMLGNSITHGANWNELLGRPDVVERGVTSDIILGYINRLEYVIELNPEVCFIMGGVNDVYNWTPVNQIFDNYKKMILKLKVRGIQPVIQSTLYVGRQWPSSADRNKEILKLNKLLSDYAKKENLVFIDLNKKMSLLGFLKSDLTYDGIHLNGKGFGVWAKEVEEVLNQIGI